MEYYKPNHFDSDHGYTMVCSLTGFDLRIFNHSSLQYNLGNSPLQLADFDKFNGQLGGLHSASLGTRMSSSQEDHHIVIGQVTFDLPQSYLGKSWDQRLEDKIVKTFNKQAMVNHDGTLVTSKLHNPVSFTTTRVSAGRAQIVSSSYIHVDDTDIDKYTDLTSHIQLWGELMDMGATLDGSHHLESGPAISLIVGTSNQLLISDTELAMLSSSSIKRGSVPIRSDVISDYEKQCGVHADPVILDEALELLRNTSVSQLHIIEALRRSATLRRQWLAGNNHRD